VIRLIRNLPACLSAFSAVFGELNDNIRCQLALRYRDLGRVLRQDKLSHDIVHFLFSELFWCDEKRRLLLREVLKIFPATHELFKTAIISHFVLLELLHYA